MDPNTYQAPTSDAGGQPGSLVGHNLTLLGLALIYPVLSIVLLFMNSGVAHIPGLEHWVLFVCVFPVCAWIAVLWAKLAGARFLWINIVAFAGWMGLVGWFHHWLITAIWATI